MNYYFPLLGFPHFFSIPNVFNSGHSPVFWPRNCIRQSSLSRQLGTIPPNRSLQVDRLSLIRFDSKKQKTSGVFVQIEKENQTQHYRRNFELPLNYQAPDHKNQSNASQNIANRVMAGWHSDVLFPLPPPNSPNSPPGLQDHPRICYKSKHNGCNQKKIICRRTINTFAVVLTPDWEGVTDQKQHLKVCLTDLSITPGTCFVRSQDESITTCRTKHESFSRMLNGSQTYPEGISKMYKLRKKYIHS